MRRALFLLLIGLPAFPAFAQVYSWTEAGATRISNLPPAWYTDYAPVRGPRVIVMVGNRVVDDTALAMDKRLALRRPNPSKTVPKR